jgi:murein DD-endopeptidase MepM/ murein hydrolase activator NlpD
VRGAARLGIITYGTAAGTIDLGNDPPMILGEDDEDTKLPIPRAVSWRWMSGTVLTGVTSIFLMGAALMAALSNPNQFASLPDSFAASVVDESGLVFGRKGDRVRPVEQHVASRQVLQVSTVTRQGERDFIKLKPFAKINATLSLASPQIAAQVPPYDAVRLFADNTEPDATPVPVATIASPPDQASTGPVEGEVSIKVSAFPVGTPDLDPIATLDTPEVEQIVRAAAHNGDGTAVAALAGPDNPAGGAPATPRGVKIVPENVSSIAKSDAAQTLEDGYKEKIVAVTRSENLRSLFEDNAITGDDADEIIAALSQLIDVSRLRPGQKVRIAFAADPATAALDQPDADQDAAPASDADAAGNDSVDDGSGDSSSPPADAGKPVPRALHPIRVSIYDNGAHQATVARADNNAFVRADEPTATPDIVAETPAAETVDAGGPPTLYDALYQTALAQQVPKPLIEQLIRIFAYDVDFQARVSPGDSMEVFHSMPDPADTENADPEVLFASLTLDGVEKRLYRFRTGDDSVVDYYDENGTSAKKFLIRKPVPVGRISSPFGWRVHPLLGYRRLHAGVDYAAPKGTPIVAAGNGIVERAGPSSGYGNLIEIKHTNGYETLYGHQSAFAKGIAVGVTVHQGQVIGYVGSTGLSTGPHVHFEVRINDQPVDPLRIRLPQGRVLEDNYLNDFEKERARIDNLLGNDSTPAQVTASADAPSQ